MYLTAELFLLKINWLYVLWVFGDNKHNPCRQYETFNPLIYNENNIDIKKRLKKETVRADLHRSFS